MPGKAFSLALIAIGQVLALSVWFAGAAALPAMQAASPLIARRGGWPCPAPFKSALWSAPC
jgi:hypothetical protein